MAGRGVGGRGIVLTVLESFTGEGESELTIAQGDTVVKAPDTEQTPEVGFLRSIA